jgi:hypothetical protein
VTIAPEKRISRRCPGGKPVSEESGSQSQRTYGVLREMILRGAFRPGERLSELPLAARLGAVLRKLGERI